MLFRLAEIRPQKLFITNTLVFMPYRKNALMNFTKWKPTPMEACEKLEQLRYLENGVKIKMVLTNESPVSIDTPEDLDRAKKLIGSF